jgi:hypothetical protein
VVVILKLWVKLELQSAKDKILLTISHGEEQLSIYESHRMDKGFCETTAKKKFQGFGIDRSKQHPKLTGKKSSAE